MWSRQAGQAAGFRGGSVWDTESLLTDQDLQIAIEHLCLRLREFFKLPEAAPR
ncbi:hypothetical protein Vau01_124400 [Virgisporangium aurantiacum]|uniref:Uncharacterized protein n=1 Tax=Virgisporangium aurantiacum TaxID=175570 RepID=A0A8J3ZIL7_9ACTN|nr:hypothetical protein Vau01_124400 [Virgisporangium aurantiacum]